MLNPFGPWEPDRPAKTNDSNLRTVSGAFPTADGWRPCPQWEGIVPTIGASPKGGASFTSPQGVSSIIAGTATSLYRGLSGGFVEIASGFNIQTGDRWRYAQFGGLAIATNGTDPMQKIDLETFAAEALGGSPPRLQMLAVVKDFLVGGVVNGDIMAIAWSGINNAESWTYGTAQSDYQRFPDGGRVNGLLSGETGLILQRNCLRRMDYIGGNLIFSILPTFPGVGCVSPHTVGQWGRMGWFWSDLGPMEWNGADARLIGDEKVNRYLQARYNNGTWTDVSTAVDPVNGVVLWAMPDQILGYHWRLERWFTLPFVSPIIFGGVTRDITIDEQDATVGAADDDLDSPGLASLDDEEFRGGDPRLYLFDASYALGAFTGTPMAATFVLGDLEIFKGRRADTRWARLETDAVSGVTLTLSYKQRLGDALTDASYTTLTTSGDMPVRTSARYHRPKVEIAAGTTWSFCNAIDITAKQGAMR